jgi:hypothetical protein
VVWVNGRSHIPFEGYQRRPAPDRDDAASEGLGLVVSSFDGHGLTPAQVSQAEQILARVERKRGRLKGPRFAARVAGIVSAVKHSRVGNRSWGLRMLARQGGLTMLRHALHHLQEISPIGARASVSARSQRKAREAYDRARGFIPDDTSNSAGRANDLAQQRGRPPDTDVTVQYGNR